MPSHNGLNVNDDSIRYGGKPYRSHATLSTRGLCLFTKKPKPKPKQTKPNHNLILFQCQWGVWMLHCLLFVQATNSVWMRIALSLYGGNNTCNQHQNSVFSLWNQKDTVTLNSINLKRYCYARSINLNLNSEFNSQFTKFNRRRHWMLSSLNLIKIVFGTEFEFHFPFMPGFCAVNRSGTFPWKWT